MKESGLAEGWLVKETKNKQTTKKKPTNLKQQEPEKIHSKTSDNDDRL